MYQGLLSKPRSQVVLCHSSSSLTYEGDVRGSNIGLAGCPKRVKIEARCRMTKILMAVRGGIEILRQERDLPILTGVMGDSQLIVSLKLTARCGIRKEKFTGYGEL